MALDKEAADLTSAILSVAKMPSPKDKGVSPRQPLVDEAVYRRQSKQGSAQEAQGEPGEQ